MGYSTEISRCSVVHIHRYLSGCNWNNFQKSIHLISTPPKGKFFCKIAQPYFSLNEIITTNMIFYESSIFSEVFMRTVVSISVLRLFRESRINSRTNTVNISIDSLIAGGPINIKSQNNALSNISLRNNVRISTQYVHLIR